MIKGVPQNSASVVFGEIRNSFWFSMAKSPHQPSPRAFARPSPKLWRGCWNAITYNITFSLAREKVVVGRMRVGEGLLNVTIIEKFFLGNMRS